MNLDDLLLPIEGDRPAGASCVYDNGFQAITDLIDYLALKAEIDELRRTAKGPFDGENEVSDRKMAELALKTAEERHRMQVLRVKDILGKEPEPAKVASAAEARCIAMLKTTGKDLRVAQHLIVACLKLRGLGGFLEGLTVFEGLLRSFPETVHPQPDEDDPSDDQSRAMVLSELVCGSACLAMLRETVLASSRAGRLTFRDAEVLGRHLPPDPSGTSLSSAQHLLAVIRGQLAEGSGKPLELISDADVRELMRGLHMQLTAAEETLHRLAKGFRKKADGNARSTQLLARMGSLLGHQIDELDASSGLDGVATFLKNDTQPPAAVAGGSGKAQPAPGRSSAVASSQQSSLATREDARRQILELAVFLEKLEPSHPAPLFLRRAAKLLAAKSFFDIVGDMIPEASNQVETLTGQKMPESAAASS